jgi:hypothetical protein
VGSGQGDEPLGKKSERLTAANDLKTSKSSTGIPAFIPNVLMVFVAPAFPLPTVRISIP